MDQDDLCFETTHRLLILRDVWKKSHYKHNKT